MCGQEASEDKESQADTEEKVDSKKAETEELPEPEALPEADVEIPESEETDSTVIFYNNMLRKLYPQRELTVSNQTYELAVHPNSAEDIEGGGISRSFYEVLEGGSIRVGLIAYDEDNYHQNVDYPFTLAMAILEPGNFMVTPFLDHVEGRTVLRISSNESGQADMGPYHYTYFQYSAYLVNRSPLHTSDFLNEPPNLDGEIGKGIVEKISNHIYGDYTGMACEEAELENCVPGSYQLSLVGNGIIKILQYTGYETHLFTCMDSKDHLTVVPLDYRAFGGEDPIAEKLDLESIDIPIRWDNIGDEQDNSLEFLTGTRFLPAGRFVR